MSPVEPGSPAKTVVLAVGVGGERGMTEDAQQSVRHAVVAVVGFTAELQFSTAPNEIPIVAVFKSSAPLSVLIPTLIEKLNVVEQSYGISTHMLLHYGMVFTQMKQGKAVYVGSALQTARRHLRSVASPTSSRFATRDFAISERAADLGLQVEDNDVLVSLTQARRVIAEKKKEPILTPSQIRSITPLLAQHIGPLALALVKDMSRRSSSKTILIQNLSREISDSSLRKQFESDVRALLNEGVGAQQQGRIFKT